MELVDFKSALESEKVVLSAILYNNSAIYTAGSLKPEDFSSDMHREIFKAMREFTDRGATFDAVTLHNFFEEQKKLSLSNYVTVFDDTLAYSKIENHVIEVQRASQRRRIIATLRSSLAQAEDLSEENSDVIALAHERLLTIAASSATAQSFKVSEFSEKFYTGIRKIRERGSDLVGLTTSLRELDKKTTGLRKGEYIVIGAVPGDGKTAFVLQIVVANMEKKVPTLLFSQEMSKEAVLQRAIPQLTGGKITARKLRSPADLFNDEMPILEETRPTVDSWPLWVNDASSLEVTELVAHAYSMIHRHGIRLIVVDYLQLLKAEGDKRYEQVSRASGALRELAKSQKVPVVVVSQLARPGEKQKRRPTLFDLKESGQIEQDAHLVLFIYRPINKAGFFTHEDELIIGKQREGPTGVIPVVFDRDCLMFKPREKNAGDDQQVPQTEEEQEDSWWNRG